MAAFPQNAGVFAQAHGAAFCRYVYLIGHQRHHRIGGKFVKFRRMRAGKTGYVSGKLYDGNLHTKTYTQIRDFAGSGKRSGGNHTFNAAVAKTAGHQNAFAIAQMLRYIFWGEDFRIHPFDGDNCVVGCAGVEQRFHNTEIGVVQLGIFTHQGNLHLLVRILDFFYQSAPGVQIRLGRVQMQLFAHNLIQTFLGQHQRHLIQGGSGGVLNDAGRVYVAEQADFPANILRKRNVAAAYQNIRLNADGKQLLYRVLSGLGF